MPVATVCIPYAEWHAPLVERAVRSAEAQTVKVDVITYCDHERRGPGYGRNRMAEQARTPFLLPLDADDLLEPECVEVMLAHWEPGSYVYSDWWYRGRHIRATPCYVCPVRETETQAGHHLVNTLFPTRLYQALGGYDETLRNYEDTEFFWRANACGVISIRVPQPLFIYSEGGERAAAGRADPERDALIRQMYAPLLDRVSTELCKDMTTRRPTPRAPSQTTAKDTSNHILVRATHKGNRQIVGSVTGTIYGRFRRGERFWMDPRDVEADSRFLEAAELDAAALSPTADEIVSAQADTSEAQETE